MNGSPSQRLSYGGGTTTVAESDLEGNDTAKVQCCDRISTLPDEILCFILSFLTTKEAVAASVLSKRWKPLWRSVPAVDFDRSEGVWISKEDYDRLVEGVNSVILHNLHHPIHKFRLCCSSPFTDHVNVTRWVNAAVQRRLHHIDLSLNLFECAPPNSINLSSIFNCETLVVLKLMGYFKLEPISSIYLPSLQVLHLEYLEFSERGCLAELLSGCPVLEDFKQRDIFYESGGDSITDRDFETLPMLLRADISNSYSEEMLKLLNNVKFLHVVMECMIIKGSTDPYDFPMFHNLTHIELQYNYYSNGWSEVMKLLKHCPNLQVLVIYQPKIRDWVSCLSKEMAYPPSMLHLKRCTEEKFEFARYIAEDSKEGGNMQWRWQNS